MTSPTQSRIIRLILNWYLYLYVMHQPILVRGEFKVKNHKNYLLPSCCFILTVHDITKTNLLILNSIVHKYIKSWCGLAKSAAPEVIHIPHLLEKSVYLNITLLHISLPGQRQTPRLISPSIPVLRGRGTGQGNFLFPFSVRTKSENIQPFKKMKTSLTKSINDEITKGWINHL